MMSLSIEINNARARRIATVLRRKIQDCPEGIGHTTILLRRINRKLGPISQFKRTDDLRIFMQNVLGLTLSRFGRPTWMLDDSMLLFLVRMAPSFPAKEAA
ncbi:hypothetical protein [Pseudodesulfovibrio karagichevae]|uniref:Uncharacterized protein n=1 Tax=Pseudodesulfovibrio karagichevae TaxID=3239305 RepID=A0ABV4K5I8_9BACT